MTFPLKQLCGATLLLLGSASALAAVEAPRVTAQSGLLVWEPVDAITINVHRADGSWLESIPGDSTEWIVPEPGRYFLVGADHGDWQDWGKSNVVNVNDDFVFGELDPAITNDLVIDNYYAQVYSQTSAEIFWERSNAAVVSVEVFRDDGESWIIDGNSFYDGDLELGTTYYYSLSPQDASGNFGPEVNIQITTADYAGPGVAIPSTPTSISDTDADTDEDSDSDTGSESGFNSRTDSWFLDGNTLRFAVPGWFQVQDSTVGARYETVCQGVSTCELQENKSYQILNHTTGEVWHKVRLNRYDIVWQQYGTYSGHIYWSSVVYNYEPPGQYNVYINDEFVVSTGQSNTPLYNLARGSIYRATVYAVLADGTEELVADDTFVTEGLLTTGRTFGRPAVDQDTFGFEIWDLIDEEIALYLPSDCLFAIPSGSFCFSPSSRYFMEFSSFDTTRPITWEFPLPGENSTNHIEGLAHYYGTGGRRSPAKRVALLADVTTEFGQSQYEISVFHGVGSFVGTYPILEDLRFSAGDGAERQINLDGADLRLTLGPVRPDPGNPSPFINVKPRRLLVAGEYYEPTGSGNRSDLSGWEQEGAFLFELDADTGETLSKTFFSGLRVEDVPAE